LTVQSATPNKGTVQILRAADHSQRLETPVMVSLTLYGRVLVAE
jgi:hypothetical protein